jgi:hypothetical protein
MVRSDAVDDTPSDTAIPQPGLVVLALRESVTVAVNVN